MLPNPEIVKAMYVYEYTFLDDLSFIKTPEDYAELIFFASYSKEQIQDVVDAVKEKILSSGWEGDGEIGVIWIPPFVDTGFEDTAGNYFWHVKQSNNGISYILSEYPLEFSRIEEQNWSEEALQNKGTPESIIQSDIDSLISISKNTKIDIEKKLESLSSIGDDGIKNEIMSDVLIYSQGVLVRSVHEFLDDCYLRFLIEALNGNSSGIKLRKSRVQLSFDKNSNEELEPEANTWLTIQGIISDMWKAYKFEPYKSKTDMLFKSIEFEWKVENQSFLMKHVAIRNCMQHHEGHLDRDTLNQSGFSSFTILGPDKDIELKMGKPIVMTKEELCAFCDLLENLAQEFGSYVFRRVPARYYVKDKAA
jgi:hypothetical protein